MIAGEQHIRDLPTAIFGRPSVVRILKESGGMRIVPGAVGITQNAGKQTSHGVDDDQGRQLSTAQHIIAYRNFIGHQVFQNTFIHPFIAPAQQGQTRRFFFSTKNLELR
jgi:hypothetical protein